MTARLIALLLAALGVIWLVQQNHVLRSALSQSTQLTREQSNTIAQLKAQRAAADALAANNEQAQVALRQQLNAASEQAVRREQTITRLLHENDAFRRWYNTQLPDAVRRVHQRPACPSAGHCLQPLPAGQPVSDAGQRSTN
ncbi:hypothetical protein UYSO10_4847 [Kosakonia radicincitans]|uniref:Rz-like lysis system protein LysB n=1 Tax=Kosakonia radicincitans TaxID=283686 RepID=UPI00118467A8|nr:Rz-like lysis system protein LysB [Kosakonia radicincitans]VVT53708.1 hypothetical protein UYSO10_4847 [Kosakonia radicincitans]